MGGVRWGDPSYKQALPGHLSDMVMHVYLGANLIVFNGICSQESVIGLQLALLCNSTLILTEQLQIG